MNLFNGILLSSGVIVGGEDAAAKVTEAVVEGATQATQAAARGGNSMLYMILYIAALVALFYFLAIRPQKKREKELQSMQNSISVGDWIVTSSGFYGKVVDIVDQVFVVEFGLNKGVRIPVRKSEVIGNKEPNLTINSNSDTDEEKKK